VFGWMVWCGDGGLTAGATSAGGLVLGGGLLACALESRLLATGALGFFGADAAAITAAAGDGDGAGGRGHYDGGVFG
jgi:hypothetical protein